MILEDIVIYKHCRRFYRFLVINKLDIIKKFESLIVKEILDPKFCEEHAIWQKYEMYKIYKTCV